MLVSMLIRVATMNLLLSSDNALMIAVLSNAVTKRHRLHVLVWSYLVSGVLQLALLAVVAFLFHFTFLQAFFGLFICFMAFQLLHKDQDVEEVIEHQRMLPLVAKITLGNLMMSFENAAALVGIAGGQVWIAWIGILITSAVVFFGSHVLAAFLDRFDFVVYVGSVLLFWIGAKLVFTEPMIRPYAATGTLIASGAFFLYAVFTYLRLRSQIGAR